MENSVPNAPLKEVASLLETTVTRLLQVPDSGFCRMPRTSLQTLP